MVADAVAVSCRTCGERVGILRGCCGRCYAKHHRNVQAGRVTWPELIQQNKVEPPSSTKARSIFFKNP